ncbi:MAG: serine/threonine protein kinase, partial [Xanthomonadales bacterium]|nr:serine/threonine protein kinase [Xanthomonadales bacterium]
MTDAATQERQRRRYAILRELLDLEPAARAAALAVHGAVDPVLAGELRELLDLTDAGVLDRDAAGLAAELVDAQDDALAPGATIGAWRVLRALGSGGMGSVHLVERAGDGYVQQGALKLIKRGMDSGEIVARFRRERGILSRLNHPNIARLLDGGTAADGRSFLVMEYVDGETLDAWSERAQASGAVRVELFLALCAAVAHAHHQLVVHRDIKPGNVMVARDGEPRLLDFGIAKVLADDDAESTRTLHGPVSRAYAAPEQLGSGIVTTATDIYQLGLLLRHLFGTDVARGDLAVVIARATDADPARRYATVEALAEDVRRWRDGRPILARADSAGYRLRRFVARHKLAVAFAALAVLGLVGAAAVALWQADRAEREATLARSAQAFLASVFDAAAPDAEAGARVTARDLLDRGSQRIDSDLADSPQLRAELLGTFGTLYRQLGQYESADTMLARALEAWPDMDSGTRQRLAV